MDHTINFLKFCHLCDKILKSDRPRKSEIIKSFISNFRSLSVNVVNFFPVMRLLLPQLDRDRQAYGIKEHVFAKMYTRVLCLPPDGSDALKLLNFRASKISGKGDFAEVAFFILKKRCGTGGQLTIKDVNQSLDEMAKKHAEHDPRGVDAELTRLVSTMSAEEQKWFIRIVLKEMNLGIGPSTLLDAYHPDAREYYDVTSSLSKLCETLTDPAIRLSEIEIQMFHPFRPMLSEELDIKRLDVHFLRFPYYFIETKMDGERFQIHMQDGKFRYFSRRAFEYTENFGADASSGMLTPKLSKLLKPSVNSIILDGEMMCWNTHRNVFTTKGMDIDVKKLNETHVHRPCFCPFDVLYLNGEVLTKKPLHVRLQILEEIITPKPGVVTLVPRQRVSTKEEVWTALNKAIDDCEEGIIFKDFNAVYKPNARKHGGWYKIKPEYSDGLMDTLDLLIVGGYFGEGRFGGTISHFLCAVKNGSSFWSAVRVGCGYSMVELEKLQRRLEPHWLPPDSSCPSNVEWTKRKPDKWIQPSDSVVLEIKASEIVPSTEYRTGSTLRFARVINIRYDRDQNDCCTYDELETKRKNAAGKLTSNHFTNEDGPPAKKKSKRLRKELGEQFKGADVTSVDVVSNMLEGKEICVLNGCEKLTKHDIEKRIVKFGGKIVQNPGVNTWCVLSDGLNIRVKNISASGKFDVIKSSWLVPLLSRSQPGLLDQIPRDAYLSLSFVTGSRLRKSYDQFGDHYTVPATLASLKYAMEAARSVSSILTEEEKYELDVEMFGGNNPYSIFRGLLADIPSNVDSLKDHASMSFALRATLAQFCLYGGRVASQFQKSMTHLLCLRDDEPLLAAIKEMRRSSDRKFYIVSPDWVQESISCRRVLPENSFLL